MATLDPYDYGKVKRTSEIDGVGSKMIQSATLHEGKETGVKTSFEIRVKVTNEKQLLMEFMDFRAHTKNMVDASFRIEHTAGGNKDGYFYAVKCWTEV